MGEDVRKIIEETEYEDKLKKEIEDMNLWYPIECEHCKTFFLVEDSIDLLGGIRREAKTAHFDAYCPRCQTKNTLKATNRVKLQYVRKADDEELDSFSMGTSQVQE